MQVKLVKYTIIKTCFSYILLAWRLPPKGFIKIKSRLGRVETSKQQVLKTASLFETYLALRFLTKLPSVSFHLWLKNIELPFELAKYRCFVYSPKNA